MAFQCRAMSKKDMKSKDFWQKNIEKSNQSPGKHLEHTAKVAPSLPPKLPVWIFQKAPTACHLKILVEVAYRITLGHTTAVTIGSAKHDLLAMKPQQKPEGRPGKTGGLKTERGLP